MTPAFLDEAQVRLHLRWEPLIAAMERELIEFSAGRVVQPVRQFRRVERHDGWFLAMPAVGESVGIKRGRGISARAVGSAT